MTIHDCEAVRDLLPLRASGRLDDVRARAVGDHLDGCGDCRAELAVLRAVAATTPVAPAGLEARVLTGLAVPQTPVRTRLASGRRRWVGLAPAPLAAAATFAAALLGGVLLYDRLDVPPAAPPVVEVDATLAWAAGAGDPLVQGATTLAELTDEELEQLLTEMEL